MPDRPNQLQRSLAWLRFIPAFLRPWAMSRLIGFAIPFVRTARLEIERLDPRCCRIRLRTRRRVRNHIGGAHAAAAALLAETATGLVFGMNTASDQLPLLKHMDIEYVSRARGALLAEAILDEATGERIRAEARGEVVVPVTIADATGAQTLQARMVWAWVSRREDSQPGK